MMERVEEKSARVVCVSVNINRRRTFSVTASKPLSYVCSSGGQFLTELENRNTLHISTRALFAARAKHDLYDSYYSYHPFGSTRA